MSEVAPVAGLKPPYYAVVFTNQLTGEDEEGYHATAARMQELARGMDGFLGIESAGAAEAGGLRMTVSYWRDLESIKKWREHAEHRLAQEKGKSTWYRRYELRVCRVERGYGGGG